LIGEKRGLHVAVDTEQLYQQYGPMVLRRCRTLLRDEDLALDAMQDTFVQVLRRRDMLDDAAPSGLLYRIATNVCLNKIRSRKRHPENPGDDLLTRIADSDEPETQALVRSALDKLFARERESTRVIAVLHLLDGLTLEETAQEVGLSVSGVRKRLRSLRSRLIELEGVA